MSRAGLAARGRDKWRPRASRRLRQPECAIAATRKNRRVVRGSNDERLKQRRGHQAGVRRPRTVPRWVYGKISDPRMHRALHLHGGDRL